MLNPLTVPITPDYCCKIPSGDRLVVPRVSKGEDMKIGISARTSLGLFLCLALAPQMAHAGIEPDNTSTVLFAHPGTDPVTLMVRPDGNGPTFAESRTPWGDIADATVTLILRDNNYDPIAGYPAEDLWLESLDNGLTHCSGGTIADADTDGQGTTRWSAPLRAGGFSTTESVVMANGAPVWAPDPRVPLMFNSPDINGDLRVDLTDLQQFAVEYFQTQGFRADLQRDGQVNLSDLALFAYAFGTGCP